AAIEADLLALRMRITGWSLPADGVEGGLEEGLLGIYRRGRAGHRRAGRGKADGLTLHRWRKHVKELRYAAEVLDLRTSPGKRAASSGRLAKLARRADELAETLGEEHDLAVLEELVRADTGLRRRKGSRRALLRAIARRRARLRERALGEGERIYGLAPGRMARRIARARARARARAHTRARARRLESV
ncbi:MAG TPA: CHAD domain-containing protein, partial [Solirubrobacteraceae bacterium]|nr:CHAD domain-containing protein [Solirubrobacteraceae bacterium]